MAEPSGLAALFLKYDYAETKDFAKSFLTLASGILVFSIAFSEKVVDVRVATFKARLAMAIAWVALILSIVACGVALCFLSLAAGEAVYGGNFEVTAFSSYKWITLAGVLFVTGLLSMVTAAVISLFRRKNQRIPQKPE